MPCTLFIRVNLCQILRLSSDIGVDKFVLIWNVCQIVHILRNVLHNSVVKYVPTQSKYCKSHDDKKEKKA